MGGCINRMINARRQMKNTGRMGYRGSMLRPQFKSIVEGSAMSYYKITVNLDGRDVEATVKEGVVSSIETGALASGKESPEHKVTIIAGQQKNQPTAWIQVSKYQSGAFSITHEGWVSASKGELESSINSTSTSARIASVQSLDSSMKSVEDAEFGLTSCCTSNGSGCYVKCCGGCCADPTRCPGAGCCP